MTDTAVIILAAGRSTRWRHNVVYSSKHFVPIWGEPLIQRMIRQLALYRATVTVLGNTSELLAITGAFDPCHRTKCESIFQADSLWKEQTHVLCGDVVFSNKALDYILYYPQSVKFYGDVGGSELFGFTFRSDFHSLMRDWLQKSVHSGGNLWNLFRTACEIPQDSDKKDENVLHRFKYDPLTRDFDTMKDYLKWCAEHPEPIPG